MKAQTTELKYNSDTYVYNIEFKDVYNIKNNLKSKLNQQKTCEIYVENSPSSIELLKTILSPKDLERFTNKNARLMIMFICNAEGQVLEVGFSLSKINLEEFGLYNISKIEKALVGKQLFTLQNTCSDVKYYNLTMIARFKEFSYN